MLLTPASAKRSVIWQLIWVEVYIPALQSLSRRNSNSFKGFDTLLTWDITQSSAMQRTGRAGRDVSGHISPFHPSLI